MDGLVFAAGKGTRLRPLTDDRPKPLLHVDGRPLLTHCLETLVECGVERVLVIVGYRGARITARYGDTFRGRPIEYIHQDQQRGMAHALLAAEQHVSGDIAMVDGDCLIDANLRPLLERHRKPGVHGTLLVNRVSHEAARTKAICELGPAGRLHGIANKPTDPPDPAHIAGGFQTATPGLIEACRSVEPSPRGEYELADAIANLVEQGQTVIGMEVDGWVRNVNTREDLKAARRYFD